MPDHDIVVVGASAGGVEALVELTRSLSDDLPAALFVVLHVPSTGTSALPDILGRQGKLSAAHAKDGEPIETGRIYVAPPDHHVLLRTGHVHLARGPRENGHRPAVDPLFRSAAHEYASRASGSSCRAPSTTAPPGWPRSSSGAAWPLSRSRPTPCTRACQAAPSPTCRSITSRRPRPWGHCWPVSPGSRPPRCLVRHRPT